MQATYNLMEIISHVNVKNKNGSVSKQIIDPVLFAVKILCAPSMFHNLHYLIANESQRSMDDDENLNNKKKMDWEGGRDVMCMC